MNIFKLHCSAQFCISLAYALLVYLIPGLGNCCFKFQSKDYSIVSIKKYINVPLLVTLLMISYRNTET